MKKNTVKKLVKNRRGASMVEYALLLVAILILAAVAVKKLGYAAGQAAANGGEELK